MNNKELEPQDIIALLNVYLNEFIYRNKLLWSNSFKFFYAILMVILLPNISDFLNINLPALPILLFRIIGLLMTFAFMYVVLGYAKRFEICSNAYLGLIKKLNPKYQKQNMDDMKFGKFFIPRTSYIVIFLMFISLLFINAIFIYFDNLHCINHRLCDGDTR